MAKETTQIADSLRQLDPASPLYATQIIDSLLAAAQADNASDLHLQPTPTGLAIRWRLDGVLQKVADIPRGTASDIVSRLKVLAELPTYRTDIPQEGRIRRDPLTPHASPPHASPVEMRVSTFPSLFGERAVVRLFAGEDRFSFVSELQLPTEIETALLQSLVETSGAVLLTGPAGSGKTTTAYACLRQIARDSGESRNIVTLEDPIEVAVPGVSQSQVQPAAGFTLATGLRSLMRQDPEVILVGEVRDTETAETVFQAALTGHLVLSTFHAGSATGAISRLLDMGLEPYLLTSGLKTVVHQRLVRKLCDCASALTATESLGLPITQSRAATGCDLCRHTGYRGRLVLAELLPPLAGLLRQAILDRQDTTELTRLATSSGMASLFHRACSAIESGHTTPTELRRILGFKVGLPHSSRGAGRRRGPRGAAPFLAPPHPAANPALAAPPKLFSKFWPGFSPKPQYRYWEALVLLTLTRSVSEGPNETALQPHTKPAMELGISNLKPLAHLERF
jgi:general secretion pathway protein E